MPTTVSKWGNSFGVRIPKAVLKKAKIKEEDKVVVFAEEDKIIIEKTKETRHISLMERLAGFDGEYLFEEWDIGEPVGEEVW